MVVVVPRLKYRTLRFLLKTIGRLSDGVDLGWRTGFDSGAMLQYVYENEPRGKLGLGKLIDAKFLSNPVWDAVRSRRDLLVHQLTAAIAKYDRPVVFDLAAGLASYLFMLPAGSANFIAGDYDANLVRDGHRKANAAGRTDITFAQNDALNLERFAVRHADILVSSGFFDILTHDDDIRTVLQNGSAITSPGARWVFTVQESHPDLELLRESLVDLNQRPWDLVPRPAGELVRWAEPLGWRLETVAHNAYFGVGTLLRQ